MLDESPATLHPAIGDFRQRGRAKQARVVQARVGQHGRGRSTAWERINQLLDAGTFSEVGAFVRHRSHDLGLAGDRPLGDAVVTGYGLVHGRPVCVFAHDFTVFGGSLGEVVGEKIIAIMDMAMDARVPIVGINDSAGGRIQEGVVAQASYGEIFSRNVHMSGMVPQISLIMGPCAGGAAYSPALTDFVVMVDKSSHMFITGPAILRQALGEEVGFDELGGAFIHSSRSGSAHHMAATEGDAIEYARELLSYLPPADGEPIMPILSRDVTTRQDLELNDLIPAEPHASYDVREVLNRVLDSGRLHEVHSLFAPNIVVGFAKLNGQSIGVVANQPAVAHGMLDIDASEKAARFVRTCDAFDLPVLTLVDTLGFQVSTGQEWCGAARRGAKLLHAYAEATVPLLTVITRNAAGIAYVAMGSRHLGADISLAWPTARIEGDSPYPAAERGFVHEVIEPSETRARLCRALRVLRTKQRSALPKKHDNLPL